MFLNSFDVLACITVMGDTSTKNLYFMKTFYEATVQADTDLDLLSICKTMKYRGWKKSDFEFELKIAKSLNAYKYIQFYKNILNI